MEYIKIENGIITEHIAGVKPEGEWIEVKEFWGGVGEPVEWYDEEWNRIDDITLYDTNIKPIPKGMKFNDDHTDLVEMNGDEKIIAGLSEVPDGMKIVDNNLVPMTEEERVAVMTTDEKATHHRRKRNGLIRSEIWKIERHTQEQLLNIETTLSNDEVMNLLRYIQELRDLTEQPNFPNEVIYPTLDNSQEEESTKITVSQENNGQMLKGNTTYRITSNAKDITATGNNVSIKFNLRYTRHDNSKTTNPQEDKIITSINWRSAGTAPTSFPIEFKTSNYTDENNLHRIYCLNDGVIIGELSKPIEFYLEEIE